jgi:phospholipid/cholesterol/gamma-HCH transport system substrate-binding protein
MPRTRSLGWAELKIGLLTIIALVLAGTLVFALSGDTGLWWQQYPLKTVFGNIAGLKEGAPVRVAGVEVGTVTRTELIGDQVEVSFEVNQDVQPRITTTSTATLGSVSLLGESSVDITPSTGGTPIPEWGYVPATPPSGTITEVATQATKGLEEATKLISEIRAGRGTVGQLFTDDALYREINAFVSAAQSVARNLSEGRGTIGRLANDPTAARSLEASLKNLETVTARIQSGEGSLGRLLNDDTLAKSANSATANLDAITGRINRGEGTAGKLVTDTELYNRLLSMADRLEKVSAGLQQGEGTAGQLLRDRQLYENMNGTVSEVRNLVRDIRADPRKYLNVRVSLF